MRTWLTFLALSYALLPAAYADNIDERASLAADGSVEISNVAGSIEIRGWDRNEIEVTGDLWEGAEELVFESDGRHARVEVRHSRGGRNIRDTDLVIRVPAGVELDVTAVSADVDSDGITGAQALQSVSGDVVARFAGTGIEARTVSGDIEVHGTHQSGRSILVSVSGEIVATGLAGDVEFSTVSGDAEIEGTDLSRLRGDTVSGDIDLDIGLAANARAAIEAVNGDIRVRLANTDDIGIDLESFNGDIDDLFGQSAARKSKYGPGTELRVAVGSGRTRLSVETLNGDIEIVSPGAARSAVRKRRL